MSFAKPFPADARTSLSTAGVRFFPSFTSPPADPAASRAGHRGRNGPALIASTAKVLRFGRRAGRTHLLSPTAPGFYYPQHTATTDHQVGARPAGSRPHRLGS